MPVLSESISVSIEAILTLASSTSNFSCTFLDASRSLSVVTLLRSSLSFISSLSRSSHLLTAVSLASQACFIFSSFWSDLENNSSIQSWRRDDRNDGVGEVRYMYSILDVHPHGELTRASFF